MELRPAFVLIAGLAPCVMEPRPELVTTERCGARFCGGNSPTIDSPTIDHRGFWDLNVNGVPNAQGFEVLGLSQGTAFYDFAIENSRLRARDDQGRELDKAQLTGATLWVRHGKDQYGIKVSKVESIDEVVSPFQPVDMYKLDWAPVIGGQLPGRMHAGAHLEGTPALGSTSNVCPGAHPAVLFEGDRFDLKGRVVGHAADDDWFNIGCDGHTLSKLRLTRNTIHTAPSWKNVQAAFKMLSADYCGTGRAFTVDGEPLVWRDRGGMGFYQTPLELEARWDENGATCLDSPRLQRSNSPLASATFTWAELQRECASVGHGLPRCTQHPSWDQRELVVSANYD